MLFTRLLALFIIVPVVELVVFLLLGRHVGIAGTLGLILFTALLGASLARSQGLQTLERFQQRVQGGQIPGEEVIAGTLIFVAGALLLTPGFLTDALGFSLLIPPLRATLGKWLLAHYAAKIEWEASEAARRGNFPGTAGATRKAPSPRRGQVIDVETTEKAVPEKD